MSTSVDGGRTAAQAGQKSHASRGRRLPRLTTALAVVAASFPVLIVNPSPAAADTAGLIISEFRLRGPSGANDEFIEIANETGADHTVASSSGTGYGIAASDGTTRCTIPNGTVIPNHGHYLCVNSVAYSLASYPAGAGTTATGDATFTSDIADNAGIALFDNNTGGASYALANRIDAVGSTFEANTLYKEGTGYPALTPFSIDYSFYRNRTTGSITATSADVPLSAGAPQDTDNNAADFVFVDTNGTSAGAGQRLGAPGPENLSSPIWSGMDVRLLDECVSADSPPNAVRDYTSDPANNSTFGVLDIRRTIVNNSGGNITRLRLRVVDIRTFPAPSGVADLRPRTSTAVVVTADRAPCGSGTSNITVNGTTLEQPASQPNGGGFNSSLSVGVITLATPLANGDSVDIRMLLGIQQTGSNAIRVIAEGLPSGPGGLSGPSYECFAVEFDDMSSRCNIAPTATDDSYNTTEDGALTVPAATGVLLNDTDPESDPLTAALVTGPSSGSLTLDADGGFSYTPDADFHGVDSFTYAANDGTANSNTVTVTINVGSVNDTPTATDDAYSATSGVALVQAASGVLANDSDIDGDALTATLVSGPAHGSLSLAADGGFTYTPNPGLDGNDSFTYTAGDGTANSAPATVTIGVTFAPPASPPAATTSIVASPESVVGGATTDVTGSGFNPGETVHLYLYSSPVSLGTTTADGSGNIAATVTVPAGTELGSHTIVAFGADKIGAATLGVAAPPAPTTTTTTTTTTTLPQVFELPQTGTDSRQPLLAAVVLLFAGGVLLVVRRRRPVR